MGRKVYKYSDEKHPYPKFDVPDDPASKHAYEQVRDILISYWFSKIATRDGTPALTPASSTTSLQSSPPVSPTRPSTTVSGESPIHRFASNTSKRSSGASPGTHSGPEQPTKVSALPKPLKSKKSQVWQPPVQDKSALRALEITKIVLKEMQSHFGTLKYPDLTSYVTRKPKSMAKKMEDFEKEETQFHQQYGIKSLEQLQDISSWKFLTKPKDPEDLRYLNDPRAYGFDTALDYQRQGMTMVHKRQKSEELAVPEPGFRIMWATKFMEWAKQRHEEEVKLFEEQLVKMMELRGFQFGHLQGPDDNVSNADDEERSPMSGGSLESDGAEEMEEYYEFLKRIQKELDGESLRKESTDSQDSPSSSIRHKDPVKRRRRVTQFNMGLQSPGAPVREMEVKKRAVAEEEDTIEWEDTLNQLLANEKQRQRSEAEKKGKGYVDRSVLRKDPSFQTEEDQSLLKYDYDQRRDDYFFGGFRPRSIVRKPEDEQRDYEFENGEDDDQESYGCGTAM
ncbi:hypothetical protein K469DRAFT_713344 [Zopfia rhizophila CBS 207.26]|uniref:Uncharacterized protein n=1 Tax=Zopfia rhizophila CBS 207.26 TaxID=1314779 RepID=A0A6A6DTN2_9PEZI|nr:hypothetical protein K469DRAFT_713344 [Zopfia rhizophila CBS 207.26]